MEAIMETIKEGENFEGIQTAVVSSVMNTTNAVDTSTENVLGNNTLYFSEGDDESEEKNTTERNVAKSDEDGNLKEILAASADSDKKGDDIGDIYVTLEYKNSRYFDSDEDVDERENSQESITDDEKCKLMKSKNAATLWDSDSESEIEENPKLNAESEKMGKGTKLQKPKVSALIDSDSEPESEHKGNDSELASLATPTPNSEVVTKTKSQSKVRAAAKKALDDIQTIQSEQQRLHREQNINVPYHKPRKHTLQEFLKRRTIIRPDAKAESSPVAVMVKSKNLKMTPEELEEYAKLMEERAREASDFYKSENDEEKLKPNDGALIDESKKMSITETSTIPSYPTDDDKEVPMEILELGDIASDCNINEIGMETETPIENHIQEAQCDEDTLNSKLRSVCRLASKPIITEVLQLPKLDLNDLFPKKTKEDNKENGKNLSISACVQQFIKEKKLFDTPTIKGNPDMIINLESGDLVKKQPTPVDNLLSRLLATNKQIKFHTPKKTDKYSKDSEKYEVFNIKMHVPDELETPNHKPGATYVELKQRLRDVMDKKRREMMQKKLENESESKKVEELEESYESEPENFSNIVIDDEENINEEASAILDENYEVANSDTETEEVKSDFDDIFGNSDNLDDYNREATHSDYSQHQIELETNVPRKSRIIKGLLDDSDDEGDTVADNCTSLSCPIESENIVNPMPLFQPEPERSHSDEENELIGLCSGTFSSSAPSSQMPIISQIPVTQTNTDMDPSDELLELCSGSFEMDSANVAQTETGIRKILSSSSSEEEDDDNDSDNDGGLERIEKKKRNKKLTKKTKTRILKISDDEDENEMHKYDFEGKQNKKEIDNKEEETDGLVTKDKSHSKDIERTDYDSDGDYDEDEVPTRYIDYDSDENEIIVEMSKDECLKRAMNFVEQEAELSESEWGSADEDEKNMDSYDMELGDEDEFDREKLQTELGQIHARKMLDEDIKEVRKIQELLFEDEETDGVGRQRQFKWKNAETGFSLDDAKHVDDAASGGESGDDDNEQTWRKIRFEREQLIKEDALTEEKKYLEMSSANTSPALVTVTKKINLITSKQTSNLVEMKPNSPFLISKESSMMQKKISRGSFLVRDKETLVKLAEMTKKEVDFNNIIDTAGPVSVKAKQSKNFVFTTLSENEHEMQKRKADDLLNSSSECGKNFMKRPKTEAYKNECLIDHLQ